MTAKHGSSFFESDTYKQAISNLYGIAIAGERQAVENYLSLISLMPVNKDTLERFSRMEQSHAKRFQDCAFNLDVIPNTDFGYHILSPLHDNFQVALKANDSVSCLFIQSILIETFSLAAYLNYVGVADPYARNQTQHIITEELMHLDFSEYWMRVSLEEVRTHFFQSNSKNLRLIREMVNKFSDDAHTVGLKKIDLIISFIREYQKALTEIGYNFIDRLILTVPLFF